MTGRTPRVACLALAFVVGYVLFQTDLVFRHNRSEGGLQKEQIQSAHNGSSALLADDGDGDDEGQHKQPEVLHANNLSNNVDAKASETSYAAPRRLDGKLIYYMHVHKSGGTTMREIARFNEQRMSKNGLPMWEESGGADWGCCGHDDTLEGFREWAKSTTYDYLAPEDVMKKTMDTKHYRHLISLRDAKERYISHHKHSMRKDVRKIPAFAEWVGLQYDNFHFRHICGCTSAGKYKLARERWNYTIDRLLQFDSILFVEDYERGLQKLARKLQWKLPATRWENAAQSTEQQYNASGGYVWDPRETALDDALYAVAARIDRGLEPYTAISEELQARLDDYFECQPPIEHTMLVPDTPRCHHLAEFSSNGTVQYRRLWRRRQRANAGGK